MVLARAPGPILENNSASVPYQRSGGDYNFSPTHYFFQEKMARFVSRGGQDLQPAFGVARVPLVPKPDGRHSDQLVKGTTQPTKKRAQKRKANSDVDDDDDGQQSKCNGVENKYFLK